MDSANVIIGSGRLYVAPVGTALPVLNGSVYPVSWSGWTGVGYTDDGIEFNYTPTFKDITVDEEMAPVKKPLVAEKASFVAKLAEVTLANLNRAIAGSTLSSNSNNTHDVITLKAGSEVTNNEVMIGFEGPAPGDEGLTRVIICYKAKSVGSVQLKAQRTDKQMIGVEFECLADSSKPEGERLYEIVDIQTDQAS